MVVDDLIEVISSYELPYYRQGSMSEDEEYPETFFTFWNRDSDDHAHYDNDNYGTRWVFDVNVYSSDPEKPYELLEDIAKKLKGNGWVVPGKGHDLYSDEPTHTGRGITVYFLEV